MSEIYSVTNDHQNPIDLGLLRKMLPAAYTDARRKVSLLLDLLEYEKHNLPEVTQVNVSEGTYVKAVRFKNRKELEFTFNEGSTQDMLQTDKTYAIGEKVYAFLDNITHTANLSTFHHNLAANYLHSMIDQLSLVPNAKILEILYDLFPKARTGHDDDFYNFFDINNFCSRVEHFRTYVTAALTMMLTSLPDVAPIIVCGVSLTRQSHYVLADMIKSINAKREYNLDYVASELPLDSQVYVVYVTNVWVNPASVDHGVVLSSQSSRYTEERVLRSMGDYAGFVSNNSSVILGSYAPIYDVYLDGDNYYSAQWASLGYSQVSYVPHKPWTLIQFASKDSSNLSVVLDSTLNSSRFRHRYRIRQFRRMAFINIRRNFFLADESSRKDMSHSKFLVNNLKRGEVVANWTLSKIQMLKVRLKSKRLSYNYVTIKDATQTTIALSKLEEDVSYTIIDLNERGWNSDSIARSVQLGLLTVWKESTILRYKKYVRTNPDFKKHFLHRGNKNYKQCSVVDEDGSVAVVRSDVPEDEIYAPEKIVPMLMFDKDFSVLYDEEKEVKRPPEGVRSFSFRTNMDSIEFQTNSLAEDISSPSFDPTNIEDRRLSSNRVTNRGGRRRGKKNKSRSESSRPKGRPPSEKHKFNDDNRKVCSKSVVSKTRGGSRKRREHRYPVKKWKLKNNNDVDNALEYRVDNDKDNPEEVDLEVISQVEMDEPVVDSSLEEAFGSLVSSVGSFESPTECEDFDLPGCPQWVLDDQLVRNNFTI